MTSVSPPSGSPTTPAAGAAGAVSPLKGDLDSFLRLLVAQLRNQDPLQPTDSTQFVTQLAMFSQAEQAVNTNRHLEGIADMVQGRALGDAANLLGTDVVATSEFLAFDGKHPARFTYTAPPDTREIKIEVVDEQGNVVRSIEGEAQPGFFEDKWNGETDAGKPAPPGVYLLRATAETRNGVDGQTRSESLPTQIYGRVQEMRMHDGKVVALINGQEVPYEKITGVSHPLAAPGAAD